jgi:hypothetical protein
MDANSQIGSGVSQRFGVRVAPSKTLGDATAESSGREEIKQDNQEERSFYAPMLQWTTRLRDFLGNRGYEIAPDELSILREAEFIPPPRQHEADSQAGVELVPPLVMRAIPQGPDRMHKSLDEPLATDDKSNNAPVLFPEAFDFNRFWGCFNRSDDLRLHIYPRGTGIPPPGQDEQQRAQASRGISVDWFGEDVSITWLSPSAFISTIKMSWTSPKKGLHTLTWLYAITFKMRQQWPTFTILNRFENTNDATRCHRRIYHWRFSVKYYLHCLWTILPASKFHREQTLVVNAAFTTSLFQRSCRLQMMHFRL